LPKREKRSKGSTWRKERVKDAQAKKKSRGAWGLVNKKAEEEREVQYPGISFSSESLGMLE